MHKSRLAALGIDCQTDDLEAAARFWSAALGLTVGENDGKYVALNRPDDQPMMFVQKVGHPSRIHLDIETDDREAEIARLERLGARRVEEFPRWTVMEAPTGHRFCVVNPQRPDFAETATAWE